MSTAVSSGMEEPAGNRHVPRLAAPPDSGKKSRRTVKKRTFGNNVSSLLNKLATKPKTIKQKVLSPPNNENASLQGKRFAPRSVMSSDKNSKRARATRVKTELELKETKDELLTCQAQLRLKTEQLIQASADLTVAREALSTANAELERTTNMEMTSTEEFKAVAQQLQTATTHSQQLAKQQQELHTQIADLREAAGILSAQLEAVEADLHSREATITGLTANVEQQAVALAQAQRSDSDKDSEIAQLRALVEAHTAKILDCEAKAQRDAVERKKLRNTVQELKGNIRVFCRVRPSSHSAEKVYEDDVPHIKYTQECDNTGIEILRSQKKSLSGKSSNSYDKFVYDQVFRPHDTQQVVFEEISQLVESAMDGYKVCVFAYGQTGSGKTYTMEGDVNDPSNPDKAGMIPRSVHHIFSTAERLGERGWSFQYEANFVEIYNDKIRDLLQANDTMKHEVRMVKGSRGKRSTTTSVSNLKRVAVESAADVFPLLAEAGQNRAVGETKSNARSSRSHSVFQIKIVGTNKISGEKTEGLLNLIDLAGSERLKSSKAAGARLTETKAINKSLSCLGDVIAALANGAKHVPYRNSTLTYMLQNSFGKSSKVLMFVNLSPDEEDSNESMCSLRFAAKTNSCQIGTAKRSVQL